MAQTDYLFKKLIENKVKTDSSAVVISSANELLSTSTLVKPQNVWLETATLTSSGTSSSKATPQMVKMVSIHGVGAAQDYSGLVGTAWSSGVSDWIDPSYNIQFDPIFYVAPSSVSSGATVISNGLTIAASTANFTFDYKTGNLTFLGPVPSTPLSLSHLTTTGNPITNYATTNSIWIKGYTYNGLTLASSNPNAVLTATGAAGPQGLTGPQGATGVSGTQGASGATGPSGTQGATGVSGTQGSTGASGATGPSGTQGATGVSGTQGASGATGPSGTQGATGVSGTQGSTGASGATGPSGTQGATGVSGTQGSTGASGATGPSGTQGATGVSGTQGATGATGPVGLQGATGPTGVIGIGATGATGASGVSGQSFMFLSRTSGSNAVLDSPTSITGTGGVIGTSVFTSSETINTSVSAIRAQFSVSSQFFTSTSSEKTVELIVQKIDSPAKEYKIFLKQFASTSRELLTYYADGTVVGTYDNPSPAFSSNDTYSINFTSTSVVFSATSSVDSFLRSGSTTLTPGIYRMKINYYTDNSSFSINKILFYGSPYSIRAPNYTTIGRTITGDSRMIDSATYEIYNFTIAAPGPDFGAGMNPTSSLTSDYIDTANGGFVCSFEPPVLQTNAPAGRHFCTWHMIDEFFNMHTLSFYSGTGPGGTFLPAPGGGVGNDYLLGDTFTIASDLQRVVAYETSASSGTITEIYNIANTLTRFVRIILNIYVLENGTTVTNAPVSFSNIRFYQSGQHGATFMTLKQTEKPAGSKTLLTRPTTIFANGVRPGRPWDIFVTDQTVNTANSSIVAQFSLSDAYYYGPSAAWNVSTIYASGNLAFSSGLTWISQRNSNRQNTPADTLEAWSGASVFYEVGAVRHLAGNNIAYVCILSHTSSNAAGQTPDFFVGSRWNILQTGNSGLSVWVPTPQLTFEIINAALNDSPRYGFYLDTTEAGGTRAQRTIDGAGSTSTNVSAGCRYEIRTTTTSVIFMITSSNGTSLLTTSVGLTAGTYKLRIRTACDRYTVDDIRFYGISHALQGVTGPSGAQGVPGVTGASGVQGVPGVTGPSGAQGVQGVTGPSGVQGPSFIFQVFNI